MLTYGFLEIRFRSRSSRDGTGVVVDRAYVMTATRIAFAPIVNQSTTSRTNWSCRRKSGRQMLYDSSRTNTTSAGLPPHPESNQITSNHIKSNHILILFIYFIYLGPDVFLFSFRDVDNQTTVQMLAWAPILNCSLALLPLDTQSSLLFC